MMLMHVCKKEKKVKDALLGWNKVFLRCCYQLFFPSSALQEREWRLGRSIGGVPRAKVGDDRPPWAALGVPAPTRQQACSLEGERGAHSCVLPGQSDPHTRGTVWKSVSTRPDKSLWPSVFSLHRRTTLLWSQMYPILEDQAQRV